MSTDEGLFSEKLKLIGMHCASCAIAIEKKIRAIKGVKDINVNFAAEEAMVIYNPKETSLKNIIRAVRDIGYDIYKEEAVLTIENMASPDDELIIERKLRSLLGIIECRASHISRSVSVVINPLSIDIDEIKNIITSLGFKVSKIVSEIQVEDVERKILYREMNSLRKIVAISLILALSLAVYVMASHLGILMPLREHRDLIGLSLSTPVLMFGGRRFFSGAYRALKNKTANMDTLVSLGTGSAYAFSLATTLEVIKSPETYYEAATVVIAFILLGRYMELKMKLKTGEAVRKLMQLQARTARVMRNGEEVEVPIEEVKVKDIVIIRSGEKIPVDGIIIEGQGYVDESMLTGEPIPIFEKEKDPVIAGTILKSGALKVIATRVGKETVLAQIIKLVRYAQTAKPPIQKLVDKIAGIFSWMVIAIAIITFTYWFIITQIPLNLAILFTASILLIACPCALGLATPTAIVVGVGKAAEEGIIIKNMEVLEKVPNLLQ